MPDRNWKGYNEALVRRGEILLDMDFIDSWPGELARMNEGKAGKPFVYLNHSWDAFCCACLPAAIKQLEGFTRVLTKHVDGLDTPDYTSTAWKVLREVVIHRKIMGLLRNEKGMRLFCNIMTGVMTWELRGLCSLEEVRRFSSDLNRYCKFNDRDRLICHHNAK